MLYNKVKVKSKLCKQNGAFKKENRVMMVNGPIIDDILANSFFSGFY